MRTPEDILKAKATYNDLLVQTELSSLPEGYIQGGELTITLGDVEVNPLIANIQGKQVTRPNPTNIMDMSWIVPRIYSTTYYIYIDRYGFFFVDTVADITIKGKYGTYNPRTFTRFVGKVYVNSSGYYITTELVGIQIIGYSGKGSNNEPSEGDRRVYIDDDEISFQEYTRGVWTSVNSIKIGGTDSNGVFISGVSCRQVINPLASGISQEFFPAPEYRVFNFENNYEDQNGLDDWSVKGTGLVFSSSIKKFGSYSLSKDTDILNQHFLYTTSAYWTPGESQGAGVWVYYPTGVIGSQIVFGYYSIGECFIELRATAGVLTAHTEKNAGAITNDVSTGITITNNTWHYVGLVYDKVTDKVTVFIDNTKVEGTVIGGTWTTGSSEYFQLYIPNYGKTTLGYIDEAVFSKDAYINPDIFIQHDNHNIPWNTDYSAKDLVLKPADGGRVMGGNTNLIISPAIIDLTSSDYTYTLPTGNGNGFVQDIFWSNGGTYKLTMATSDSSTIGGLTAGTWIGKGEGSMTVIYDSANNDWKVRAYEDSGSNSVGVWKKEKDGILSEFGIANITIPAIVAGSSIVISIAVFPIAFISEASISIELNIPYGEFYSHKIPEGDSNISSFNLVLKNVSSTNVAEVTGQCYWHAKGYYR